MTAIKGDDKVVLDSCERGPPMSVVDPSALLGNTGDAVADDSTSPKDCN
jgi:hypothetical protein